MKTRAARASSCTSVYVMGVRQVLVGQPRTAAYRASAAGFAVRGDFGLNIYQFPRHALPA
ncbi:MAG: hypothetical protein ACLU3I_00590 [Acutalibacteraceae bacterium]